MYTRNVFEEIEVERLYQNTTLGPKFDRANTPNDWIAYITKHAGKAVTKPFSPGMFRAQLIQVAALAIAALEQETYAPRHYDDGERIG